MLQTQQKLPELPLGFFNDLPSSPGASGSKLGIRVEGLDINSWGRENASRELWS